MSDFEVNAADEVAAIQMKRRQWPLLRYHFLQDIQGGQRYKTRVDCGDQHEADQYDRLAHEQFTNFCTQVKLTLDGQTLDSTIPVDGMYDHEFRRMRHNTKVFVGRHTGLIGRNAMSAPVLSEDILKTLFEGLVFHYERDLYEQGHVMEETMRVKMRSPLEVREFMTRAATYHSNRYVLSSEDKIKFFSELARFTDAIRKELAEYLMAVIPKSYAIWMDGETVQTAIPKPQLTLH
jgi:hypothetical protein